MFSSEHLSSRTSIAVLLPQEVHVWLKNKSLVHFICNKSYFHLFSNSPQDRCILFVGLFSHSATAAPPSAKNHRCVKWNETSKVHSQTNTQLHQQTINLQEEGSGSLEPRRLKLTDDNKNIFCYSTTCRLRNKKITFCSVWVCLKSCCRFYFNYWTKVSAWTFKLFCVREF